MRFSVIGKRAESISGKRAESISRRLLAFTPLVPGLALSLLSPSIQRIGRETGISVTEDTKLAVDTLKQLLSILSLSIQAIYGSKKGGLLSFRSGSSSGGNSQIDRAKRIFVTGAKEYVPYLLQVVVSIQDPMQLCRQSLKKNRSRVNSENSTASPSSEMDSSEISSTGTDRDWVNVEGPESLMRSDSNGGEQLAKKVLSDLSSCQDIVLYAVSRLLAQAMKYGGGEASTAVWRCVTAALTTDTSFTPLQSVSGEGDVEDTSQSTSILCHLAALVLSK